LGRLWHFCRLWHFVPFCSGSVSALQFPFQRKIFQAFSSRNCLKMPEHRKEAATGIAATLVYHNAQLFNLLTALISYSAGSLAG